MTLVRKHSGGLLAFSSITADSLSLPLPSSPGVLLHCCFTTRSPELHFTTWKAAFKGEMVSENKSAVLRNNDGGLRFLHANTLTTDKSQLVCFRKMSGKFPAHYWSIWEDANVTGLLSWMFATSELNCLSCAHKIFCTSNKQQQQKKKHWKEVYRIWKLFGIMLFPWNLWCNIPPDVY